MAKPGSNPIMKIEEIIFTEKEAENSGPTALILE